MFNIRVVVLTEICLTVEVNPQTYKVSRTYGGVPVFSCPTSRPSLSSLSCIL